MRIHRTKATIDNDGSLSVLLTGLPFARGEQVSIVVLEDGPALPMTLSYRSASPKPINHTPEGEWVLFVAGAALLIVFCFMLALIH